MSGNSYWYFGLGAASIILLLCTYLKSNTHRSLLLFLGMVGVGYIIEFVIYILLGSYHYEPNIIRWDAYYDSNMGAIASNLLCLPAIATLIAVFQLRLIWIVGFTALMVGIEWLFIHLGIYYHHWWRIEYSAIGLPFYFWLARVWYPRILFPLRGVLNYVTLLLITGALLGTLQSIPFMFFNSRYYDIGWFDTPSRNTTALTTLIWLFLSPLFVALLLKYQRKYRWIPYVVPVMMMLIIRWILQIAELMYVLVWWDTLYCVVICIVVFIMVRSIQKTLWEGSMKENKRIGSSSSES